MCLGKETWITFDIRHEIDEVIKQLIAKWMIGKCRRIVRVTRDTAFCDDERRLRLSRTREDNATKHINKLINARVWVTRDTEGKDAHAMRDAFSVDVSSTTRRTNIEPSSRCSSYQHNCRVTRSQQDNTIFLQKNSPFVETSSITACTIDTLPHHCTQRLNHWVSSRGRP